jgi:hypothetical protein
MALLLMVTAPRSGARGFTTDEVKTCAHHFPDQHTVGVSRTSLLGCLDGTFSASSLQGRLYAAGVSASSPVAG